MDANKTTAKVLKQLRDGDPISDGDLATAITTLTPVVETLHSFGERFHLAWKELHFSLGSLEGFAQARGKR